MSKPLEIFLFKGCETPLCRTTYSLLMKQSKDLGPLIAKHIDKVSGLEVNVVIADGRSVRGMNKKFRGVDKSTDVLAFPLDGNVLGEIWLCPTVVRKNADMFNQTFRKEITRVLIHGILHLAGYDHDKSFIQEESDKEEMFVLQENILSELFP